MKTLLSRCAIFAALSLNVCADHGAHAARTDVVADALTPSDVAADGGTDGASGPDVSSDDVGGADVPDVTMDTAFKRGVAVDWVVQSTGGPLEMLAAIGLANGGVAFVANFER